MTSFLFVKVTLNGKCIACEWVREFFLKLNGKFASFAFLFILWSQIKNESDFEGDLFPLHNNLYAFNLKRKNEEK